MDGARRRGPLRDAEELPAFAHSSRRARRTGDADCLRERGEPDDRSGGGARDSLRYFGDFQNGVNLRANPLQFPFLLQFLNKVPQIPIRH